MPLHNYLREEELLAEITWERRPKLIILGTYIDIDMYTGPDQIVLPELLFIYTWSWRQS